MDCVKIGDVVGHRFRIEKIVGAGSFAWVFVAYDLHSGQTVALKMLRSERFSDDETLRRFESRELRLLARIEELGPSPHVVRLLDKRLLRHEESPFLVLEYIPGPSLKEWLAEKGRLEIKEAARMGAGLARGLSVIHAAGGVHRDLKPSNVRMRHGKTPVLVDLGIARALWETQTLTQGKAPLTPRYAAPEQLEGLPATPAADVYALGVCLFEMLAGQLDRPGDPNLHRPDVPSRLAKLVAACLATDPRERPSVQQIVSTLDGFPRARSAPSSVWPAIFLSGCSIFPGQPLREGIHSESTACAPMAGFIRNKDHHEASSTETTFEWSSLDARGEIGNRVQVNLPDFDIVPRVFVDDGGEGRYELMGWFGQTCRRFSVRACADHAFVRELEPCHLPRPTSFGILGSDVNGDGMDDIIASVRTPATLEKPASLHVNILLKQADGSSRWMKDVFDLSPIDTYHLELIRRTGDVDRDGCADLVVTTYPTGGACSSSIYVLFGDCQGKFELSDDVAHVPLPANRSDIGDVDEDGFLDLVTAPDDDGDPGQTFLLRGTGQGFGEAEELIDVFPNLESGRDQPGLGSVLLEDWNGDGHLDVILQVMVTPLGASHRASNVFVHLGHGEGTFGETPAFVVENIEVQGGISFLPIRGR